PKATRSPSTAVPVIAVSAGGRAHARRPDQVATEEPMEIRAGGPGQEPVPVSVTMRTPGHDFELAAGFLLAEGIATSAADIRAVRYCDLGPDQPQLYNVVTVTLSHPVDPATISRNFAATSSCGVCGTATLDGLQRRCPPVGPGPVVPVATLLGLPDALREGQRLFERTGGLHAAGLFRADGSLVAVREDVGRHNALDKLTGRAALAHDLPLSDHVVALSGRISYELVQKAAAAGVTVVVAVSAPSSLAVATAERLGLTTVGFVRPGRANVYSHPERVALDRP
ncbi:MAG: formate dehydrogenase accessory sulfurtransferase FdhD, partial [Acidimicrobiales bacterium]